MKKTKILLIFLVLISINFISGCNKETKPDIKLISPVDIDKTDYMAQHPSYEEPYNVTWTNYDVTFTIKEVNNVGVDVSIQLELLEYDDETGKWEMWSANMFDRTEFYIDGGDKTTINLDIDDLEQTENERRKIVIYVSLFQDNEQIKYMEVLYEEELFYWEN